MLGDNQTIKMAAMESEPDENVQFSDYFAGLDGPSKLRYRENVSICGFDPYSLKKSDYRLWWYRVAGYSAVAPLGMDSFVFNFIVL